MRTILRLVGYKGDKSTFGVDAAADVSDAIVTFLTGKTYAGGDEYSTIETGLADPALAIDPTPAEFNDMDVKAIISLKNRTDPTDMVSVRITISAPKIDVANGIATELTDEKRIIPATKAAGALGDDGNTIATQAETMLGLEAGDLKFMSGSFLKVTA